MICKLDYMTENAQELLQSYDAYLIKKEDFTMEKKIGKGGYGDVWLATHNATGTKCAVKQLYIEELDGQNLTFFVREVSILASCQDMFLLPFLGFSSIPPYLIVTEFISRGSLYDALQHKPGAPNLNSSHKTLIALGIARGMMVLHQNSIIHRDLKSLNILLDDRFLPKICDFGISRFVNDKDTEMTKEIGTPHWMAPEIFESNHYSEKVDVYAFGILLWEMLTESIPFKGKTAIQVATSVYRDDERPPIPSSCPPELSVLISSCWTRDPDQRPTFAQIFKEFSEKKVMYKGSDVRSVSAICQLIVEYDQKKADPLQHLLSRHSISIPEPNNIPQSTRGRTPSNPFVASGPPKLQVTSNIGNIDQGPRSPPTQQQFPVHHSRRGSVDSRSYHPSSSVSSQYGKPPQPPNAENVFLQGAPVLFSKKKNSKVLTRRMELSNPLGNNFPTALDEEFAKLTHEKCKDVFPILLPYFSSNQPITVTGLVLVYFCKLFERDESFVDPFINHGFHTQLPYHDAQFIPYVSHVLSAIIDQRIEVFTADILQPLMSYSSSHTQEVLHLLSKYSLKASIHIHARQVIHVFFSSSNDYSQNSFINGFVQIIYQLYGSCQWFKTDYLSIISKTISQAFILSNISAMKSIYSFALQYKELMNVLPLETVVNHLSIPEMVPYSLPFLAKLTTLPSSKRLVSSLFSISKANPMVPLILCRIAETPHGASIIVEHAKWMDCDVKSMFPVFLMAFSHKHLRGVLSDNPSIPSFLYQVISLNMSDFNSSFSTVIRRMNLNSEFINQLSTSGFLRKFYEYSLNENEPDAQSGCVLLTDALARIAYVKDYSVIIPRIPKMLRSSQNLMLQTLTLSLVLFTHADLRQYFKNNEILQTVKDINVPTQYQQYQQILVSQITSID